MSVLVTGQVKGVSWDLQGIRGGKRDSANNIDDSPLTRSHRFFRVERGYRASPKTTVEGFSAKRYETTTSFSNTSRGRICVMEGSDGALGKICRGAFASLGRGGEP